MNEPEFNSEKRITLFQQTAVSAGLIACLVLVSCSNPNEKANEAYVESVTLLKEAEQSLVRYNAGLDEKPEDFIPKFDRAMKNLERIRTKYPQSELAVKLVQGETKLNGREVAAYQSRVEQLLGAYHAAVDEQSRASKSASKSPGNFAFAMVTLSGAAEGGYQEHTYISVVSMLAKAGEYAEALKFIDEKLRIRATGPGLQGRQTPVAPHSITKATGAVAVEMLKRGATDDAVKLLQKIQLSAAWENQRDKDTPKELDDIGCR